MMHTLATETFNSSSFRRRHSRLLYTVLWSGGRRHKRGQRQDSRIKCDDYQSLKLVEMAYLVSLKSHNRPPSYKSILYRSEHFGPLFGAQDYEITRNNSAPAARLTKLQNVCIDGLCATLVEDFSMGGPWLGLSAQVLQASIRDI
jgi:hypothetical protein